MDQMTLCDFLVEMNRHQNWNLSDTECVFGEKMVINVRNEGIIRIFSVTRNLIACAHSPTLVYFKNRRQGAMILC